MKYLLDTCVISELVVKQPNEKVIQWIDNRDSKSVYLSVITIGEIRKVIVKLPDSKRRELLEIWLNDELLVRFRGNILTINADVMLTWGELIGRLELQGKKVAAMDSLIAAIALYGNFTLVTRNEDDFKNTGLNVVNPWN
ncbi:MAG: type II toxin-antitoxin system VapC family toxin [Rhizonema sp. PD37]|nr:type II toxin-antitoxin system VapC family toxin [Rhizonema sp. PD37]